MNTIFFITIIIILIIEIVIFRLTYRTEEERRENSAKLTWMIGVTIVGAIGIDIYRLSTISSAASSNSQRAEYGFFGKKKKETKVRSEKPAKTSGSGNHATTYKAHASTNIGGTTYYGDGGGHQTIMIDD